MFGEDSTQSSIYSFVRPSVQGVAQGYNCTIMAYGQTGTGKTTTMMYEDLLSNFSLYLFLSSLSSLSLRLPFCLSLPLSLSLLHSRTHAFSFSFSHYLSCPLILSFLHRGIDDAEDGASVEQRGIIPRAIEELFRELEVEQHIALIPSSVTISLIASSPVAILHGDSSFHPLLIYASVRK